MKLQFRSILIFFIVAGSLLACEGDEDQCAKEFPVCECASIAIVDADGNSLLGENNVYKPAEISLFRSQQSINIMEHVVANDTLMLFFFNDMESDQDYSLQLNDTETDILNLTLPIIIGSCFSVKNIEQFRVNGAFVEPDMDFSDRYTIQK